MTIALFPITTSPNVDQVSNIIREGLDNNDTKSKYSSMLVDIVENYGTESELGDKLIELAESRGSPFSFSSKEVRLINSHHIPDGIVGVCEHSEFETKNVVVFIVDDNGVMKSRHNLYADSRHTFPCDGGNEDLLVNVNAVNQPDGYRTFAKRTL